MLVGHSFGGLIAQRAMVQPEPPALAGLALLASVPPTGNGPMVGRFPEAYLRISIKITSSAFSPPGAFKSRAVVQRVFLQRKSPRGDLRKHMGQIATSCNVRLLDLRSLNDSLPLLARDPMPPLGIVRAGGLDCRRRGGFGGDGRVG